MPAPPSESTAEPTSQSASQSDSQPTAATSRSPWGVAGVAVACAAIAALARFWVHHDFYTGNPTLVAPGLDDVYYVETAARIARGESFDSFLAHLHPWLVTRLASGARLDVAFLGGVNAALGALTAGVVALAAGRVAGAGSAWAAGLLQTLAGVFLFHDVLPGQEAGVALATALAILCGVTLASSPRGRAHGLVALGLGAAVGVAAFGRGTSLVLLACAWPGLRRAPRRGSLVAIAAAGLVLVLAAGAVWNQRLGGALSPFPWAGGANLYLTNGPDARASVSMASGELGRDPWAIERNSLAIPAAALGRAVGPREASSWWSARTLDESGGVGALAAHMLRKAGLFWTADERGSNHAAYAEREFATLLRFQPVSGWWLLALGVGAWWLVRRRCGVADVPALVIGGTWFALTVFFPVDRYRLPALVASTILIGIAVAGWPAFRVDRRRCFQAGALVAALGLVAWAPIRERDDAAGHVAVAQAMVELGAARPAVMARIDRALDADADSGPALELRGRMELGAGRPQEAYDLLVRAAQDRRSRFSAQVAAIVALVDLGRVVEARRVANGLLSENDRDAQLLAHAALAASASGQAAEARALLDRARAVAPDHPAIAMVERRLR